MSQVIRQRRGRDRWLNPYHGGVASTSNAVTATRVYLELFAVNMPVVVDAISYLVGGTSQGQIRVGIYKATAEDTAAGGTLMVSSAATAQGSTNVPQTLSLANTLLTPGRYYIALHFEDGAGTVLRQSNTNQVNGWTQFFDQTFASGLPSTVPAVTNSASVVPGARVRVVQP